MAESFKHDIVQADFKLFVVLWNQGQGHKTPDIHYKMAEWLERAWKTGQKRLLLQAFRSSGKSTMVGLFAAWLLYRQPELRILVLAADLTLAKKMVRNVKRILERHPLTEPLLPSKPDQWAGDRFTVKRHIELRDPSMLAKGVSSNITGSRADFIICDDVEVPNTCDSAQKREDLRDRLAEIPFVLVPDGTQLFVGTPHSYFTIYAEAPRTEIGESSIFLAGFHRLKIPILDEQGESAWIERFSRKEIDRIAERSGPNRFKSQMMLEPVNIAEGRLDLQALQVYGDALDYTREINTMFLGGRKVVSASAWWDPAFGAGNGDASVVACIFTDSDGFKYLHSIQYINVDTQVDIDEATQQCRIVCEIARSLMLPSLTIEINGIGRFLPNILRNELAKERVPCKVQEVSSSRAKDVRILEAFDVVLAAQRLFVHEDIYQTPFIREMQEWKPGRSGAHDDGLDAVAGALSLEPARIERVYGSGGYAWQKRSKTHLAKSDFVV